MQSSERHQTDDLRNWIESRVADTTKTVVSCSTSTCDTDDSLKQFLRRFRLESFLLKINEPTQPSRGDDVFSLPSLQCLTPYGLDALSGGFSTPCDFRRVLLLLKQQSKSCRDGNRPVPVTIDDGDTVDLGILYAFGAALIQLRIEDTILAPGVAQPLHLQGVLFFLACIQQASVQLRMMVSELCSDSCQEKQQLVDALKPEHLASVLQATTYPALLSSIEAGSGMKHYVQTCVISIDDPDLAPLPSSAVLHILTDLSLWFDVMLAKCLDLITVEQAHLDCFSQEFWEETVSSIVMNLCSRDKGVRATPTAESIVISGISESLRRIRRRDVPASLCETLSHTINEFYSFSGQRIVNFVIWLAYLVEALAFG